MQSKCSSGCIVSTLSNTELYYLESRSSKSVCFPPQRGRLTLVCWKCEPMPIPDGEPGEGTGEVLGDGWRLPVMSIMSWPMSFSSSSGKGRSNMSSEERGGGATSAQPQFNLIYAVVINNEASPVCHLTAKQLVFPHDLMELRYVLHA